MKLWRWFTSGLICWNTFGIFLLIWMYGKNNEALRGTTVQLPDHSLALDRSAAVTQFPIQDFFKHKINPRSAESRKFREEHLNVPEIYFRKPNRPTFNRVFGDSRGSLQFPDIQDIKFNNIYWQTFVIGDTTFYLYSAYYDDRKLALPGSPGPAVVRLLGMVDRVPPPPVRCALWFNGGRGLMWASGVTYEHLWRRYWGNVHNGTLQPYLISCALPPSAAFRRSGNGTARRADAVPEMVSLMALVDAGEKKPSTIMRVRNERSSPKKEFAVCVKGLDFPSTDLSLRLLEWIHLLRILGADKVFFYELEVHPNVASLFDYLESQEIIEVIPLTLPGYQPNLHLLQSLYLHRMMGAKRLNEIIPYNDCLYRNLHKYDFIVLLDIDEVLMPTSSHSWAGLMQQIQSIVKLNKPKTYRAASYNVRNVYFFEDMDHNGTEMGNIPMHLHMSRHVIRSAEFTKAGRYIKCFHDVSHVQALHNHYPFSCLSATSSMSGSSCTTFDVSPFMAQLQHYRKDCHDMRMAACLRTFKNRTTLDTNIWRFKDQLIQAVTRDLRNLNYVVQYEN